ncbi:MAG: hypothetical protein OEY09_20210 [Gammaproteobacteria bacterium]|nr:hypothetical protein [Gammaproteobacteria bacterium]
MLNRFVNSVLIFLLATLVISCAQPILVVGEPGVAIDPDKVKVYYARRADCDYDTVGYITGHGGLYSLASLVHDMRTQAAEIGADGVVVIETRRLDLFEYIGTAKAIRCLAS